MSTVQNTFLQYRPNLLLHVGLGTMRGVIIFNLYANVPQCTMILQRNWGAGGISVFFFSLRTLVGPESSVQPCLFLSRVKPKSANSLKRLQIKLRSKMTIEKKTKHWGMPFLLQIYMYQNFGYNVDYHFSPYKPLWIQTVVTQRHHMLQGEGHISRNQTRSLFNSRCWR